MSINVKYISSSHTNAPQLLGDNYGYLVQLLRVCLCEGFNVNTDVDTIEVLTSNTMRVTYLSNHGYISNQTISIAGAGDASLNGEKLVLSYDALSVTVKSYIDLSNILGNTYSALTGVSSKVAPLGFIEKFSSGNISAFSTDEDGPCLVVDDTRPALWEEETPLTQMIAPLVWMTDSLYTLSEPGKMIVPYMSDMPTRYKDRDYSASFAGSNGLSMDKQRNGIWNIISYGTKSIDGNNSVERLEPEKWELIGNGRLFYLIIKVHDRSPSSTKTFISAFGKINSEQNLNEFNYILISNPLVYNMDFINSNNTSYPKSINNSESNGLFPKIDIGETNSGVINVDGSPKSIVFHTNRLMTTDNNGSNVLCSGASYAYNYPDAKNNKYYVSSVYCSAIGTSWYPLGKVSGLKWVNNGNPIFHKNGIVMDFIENAQTKKYYIINDVFIITKDHETRNIYNISLENEDWYNYDS